MYSGMVTRSLVVDAATNLFQAGILCDGRFVDFFLTDEDNLTGFFDMLKKVVRSEPFDRIIFCQGPGKLLGVRATLMFVRIMKIIRPELSIFSYDSLSMAHKLRNPLPLEGIDFHHDEDEDSKWEQLAEAVDDKDEIDALEFKKSLKQTAPESTSMVQRYILEDMVCVRKNSTQFYIYGEGGPHLVDRTELEHQDVPVYYLPTSHENFDDSLLIPMKYNLEEGAEFIDELSSENSQIVTDFDPAGDFKEWSATRHK